MFSPLTLRVRPDGPTAIRAFMPENPKPVKVLDHRGDELGSASLWIQILIAKNQYAAVLVRALGRDPEGSRMAEMEKARRRRSKASAILRQG